MLTLAFAAGMRNVVSWGKPEHLGGKAAREFDRLARLDVL
jgi:hypothetical protein